MLVKLRKAYPDKYADLKKAYEFAEKAHAGQKRSSGEDYFIHPCAVVDILANYGFDSSTLIAAFLHDVLEDTSVTPEELAASIRAQAKLSAEEYELSRLILENLGLSSVSDRGIITVSRRKTELDRSAYYVNARH